MKYAKTERDYGAMSCSIATTTAGPRLSRTEASLTLLSDAVERLHGAVEELNDRTAPVRQDCPKVMEEPQANEDCEASGEIVLKVRAQASSIDRAVRRINLIINLLDC